MREPFRPRVSAVFSADITVPEHEREVRFYSRVLSTGDNPLWRVHQQRISFRQLPTVYLEGDASVPCLHRRGGRPPPV